MPSFFSTLLQCCAKASDDGKRVCLSVSGDFNNTFALGSDFHCCGSHAYEYRRSRTLQSDPMGFDAASGKKRQLHLRAAFENRPIPALKFHTCFRKTENLPAREYQVVDPVTLNFYPKGVPVSPHLLRANRLLSRR